MAYSTLEWLALLITSCAIMLQTWVGIGFGLLAAPLLYLLNPAYVPGPILILGFCLSLLLVLKAGKNLGWQRVLPAIVARVPGCYCGAVLLVAVSQYTLSVLFGVSLLLAVLISWRTGTFTTTRQGLIAGGFFSGLIGTATSVGGPPMALVYRHENRIIARNELAAFFLIGTPVSIVMLALQGRIDQHVLTLSLKMIPGVLLGFWLANRLDGHFNPGAAKPLLLLISAASALVVLYRGLQGWMAAPP